ncbi:MAG: heavy metal translocating P-type ATPase, partial [Bacilli bacterium]|nr:heavy metal translocating P-type ATPase [Bacilli bacterium]
MLKYHIDNLDCAHCAQEIEDALNNSNLIKEAHLNFINKTLLIDYDDKDYDLMLKIIKNIEGEIKLELITREAKVVNNNRFRNINIPKLILIMISIMLVVLYLFIKNNSYALIIIILAYLLCSYDILIKTFKNFCNRRFFDENFLMGLASLAALGIGEYLEGIAIIIFYKIGEFFQDLAVSNSKNNIIDLMDLKIEYINVIKDKQVIKMIPNEVNINDLVLVKVGEKIPIDGIITKGHTLLDMASLTGESLVKQVGINDQVLSGSINLEQVIELKVSKNFENSTSNKIIELIENSVLYKAKMEDFITKFARIYTPIIVIVGLMLAFIPPLILGLNYLNTYIYKALIFIVVSCPCAMVLSIPLSYFAGIGYASAKGILIKGSNYLEALSKVETIVFDKTG